MRERLPSAGVVLLRLSALARSLQPDYIIQTLATHAAALPSALCWLALAALPESSALLPRWHQAVSQWDRASFLSLGLALLDALHDLPLSVAGKPPVSAHRWMILSTRP